jgi:hypothetical protein
LGWGQSVDLVTSLTSSSKSADTSRSSSRLVKLKWRLGLTRKGNELETRTWSAYSPSGSTRNSEDKGNRSQAGLISCVCRNAPRSAAPIFRINRPSGSTFLYQSGLCWSRSGIVRYAVYRYSPSSRYEPQNPLTMPVAITAQLSLGGFYVRQAVGL